MDVNIPRKETIRDNYGLSEVLRPRIGNVYLVEVGARYGKKDSHTVQVERYGYLRAIVRGRFLFLVPLEAGINRFLPDQGEGVAIYHSQANNPPVILQVRGVSIPTFKVSRRTRLKGRELENSRRILQRIGLRPGIETRFVE